MHRLARALIPLSLALAACAPGEAPSTLHRAGHGDSDPPFSVWARSSYLPGVPVLIGVDVYDPAGGIDRLRWETQATLTVASGDVDLDVDAIRVLNGRGSALVTPTGSGPFTVAVEVDGEIVLHTFDSLEGRGQVGLSGPLTDGLLSWSGIVNVTGDVTVPVGKTLTLAPGTLVLVAGPDDDTYGADIEVKGRLVAEGTAEDPITLTARDPELGWGQLLFTSSDGSSLDHTFITRGGHSANVGHSSSGPTVRLASSTVSFSHGAITDLIGKVMWAEASDLSFEDFLVSRAKMGPEVKASELYVADMWSTQMYGPNDNDGFYIRDHSAGQLATFRRLTIVEGDDDAMDVHFANIDMEGDLHRGWADKGISVDAGELTIRHTLLVENLRGMKAENPSTTHLVGVTLANNTEVGITSEFAANRKNELLVDLTDSILWGNGDQLAFTDTADRFAVRYSTVGEAWAGEGVLTGDPMFVDPAGHDYRLKVGSPAIDAGDPASAQDVDGTRADQGALPTDDGDGDGLTDAQGDCDDANAQVFPGAEELANGADDDCDGEVDEGAPTSTPPGASATPGTEPQQTPTAAGPTASAVDATPSPTAAGTEGETATPTATAAPGTDAPASDPPATEPQGTPPGTPGATEPPATDAATATPSEASPTPTEIGDGGCDCDGASTPGGSAAGLAVLLLGLGIRRRR